MGRRRKRKQERQRDQRATVWNDKRSLPDPGGAAFLSSDPAGDDLDLLFGMASRYGHDRDDDGGFDPYAFTPRARPNTCGGCREFIEDQLGGRGECLHPGSGVLLPWTDTPACPFFTAMRRRAV